MKCKQYNTRGLADQPEITRELFFCRSPKLVGHFAALARG